MTDDFTPSDRGAEEPAPRFTDRRKIDPETGKVREQPGTTAGEGDQSQPSSGGDAAGTPSAGDAPAAGDVPAEGAEKLAQERLEDLQRLQAEYVNYRRRVERDRLVARDQTVVAVVEALIPVLDDVELARQHGELEGGPFASIAEKLEGALGRFGWERYGAQGEGFDPNLHEALMHQHSDEVTEPTVTQVLQPGHKVGERIVRAARVAVSEPEG
ncbi:nucleotide exchange factor GrpE [Cellulomonas sp. APG4]|uniref:nucleotide exchange factor GrpE n=1 Tax=Cellulomonas sp. APG4 TaxID=1538656 RepID=UPI00137B90EE|nr:nucleotide exchange factor GrpE [Cellulomonas sp. APG4]